MCVFKGPTVIFLYKMQSQAQLCQNLGGHTTFIWPLSGGNCLDIIWDKSLVFDSLVKHALTCILQLPHRQQLVDSRLVWDYKLINVLIFPLHCSTIWFYFPSNIKVHNRILSPVLNLCQRTRLLQHSCFLLCFISLLRPHVPVYGCSLPFSLDICYVFFSRPHYVFGWDSKPSTAGTMGVSTEIRDLGKRTIYVIFTSGDVFSG